MLRRVERLAPPADSHCMACDTEDHRVGLPAAVDLQFGLTMRGRIRLCRVCARKLRELLAD